MALTTLSNVKTVLGITGSAQDTLLNLLIAQASTIINNYCGRTLEQTTGIIEYLSGNGYPDLSLRFRPVTAITEVRMDPNGVWGQGTGFAADTVLTAGTDYVLVLDGDSQKDGRFSNCGLLRRLGADSGASNGWPSWNSTRGYLSNVGRIGGSWTPGEGNVKVTYTGGYATIPADLDAAAVELVAWQKRNMPLGGAALSNESLGDYSYTIAASAAGASAENALASAGEMGSIRQILARYRELQI